MTRGKLLAIVAAAPVAAALPKPQPLTMGWLELPPLRAMHQPDVVTNALLRALERGYRLMEGVQSAHAKKVGPNKVEMAIVYIAKPVMRFTLDQSGAELVHVGTDAELW